MDKSPDAFRTISEVAEHLDTPAHVLRFWESRFPQIRPVKRAGGRRYYRPSDVALLTGIKRLLHDEGLTIRGVQKMLRDHGVRHVAGLSDESLVPDPLLADDTAEAELVGGPEADPVPDLAPAAAPEPQPAPARPLPADPPLPLFEAAAAQATRPTEPRRPREDLHLASLLRGLSPGQLATAQPELAALAGRLRALRTLMADRAEGGPV